MFNSRERRAGLTIVQPSITKAQLLLLVTTTMAAMPTPKPSMHRRRSKSAIDTGIRDFAAKSVGSGARGIYK